MNVALIGSGSWGTAVAGLAAARAERVTMWAHSEQTAAGINSEHRNPRYLVDYVLPENVVATTDLAQALNGADAIIFAVPSTHLRDVCHQAAPFIADETPVLCLTKGIEPESGLLMSEVIASEIGNEARVAALSGPNHAEEICRGGLSAAVIASEDPQIGETFKDLLLSTAFRIYLSQDMTGVEVCGAMKNVIAIVCGISAGSGAGDNTLALIMTRGLAEISRLVHARGGQAMTCMGLAGMGDLIATCTSEHSRNRTFGYEFAHGVSLDEYQTRTHMVVEGAVAARSVSELARSLGVDIPLTFAVEQTLYNGVTLDRALEILTDRVPSQEFYGLTSAERLLPWVPSKSLRLSFRPIWPTSRANSTRSPAPTLCTSTLWMVTLPATSPLALISSRPSSAQLTCRSTRTSWCRIPTRRSIGMPMPVPI